MFSFHKHSLNGMRKNNFKKYCWEIHLIEMICQEIPFENGENTFLSYDNIYLVRDSSRNVLYKTKSLHYQRVEKILYQVFTFTLDV